jgi:hypothetical protein
MAGLVCRSDLGLRGREFTGDYGIGKGAGFVGAIAEGFVGGLAATAEAYGSTASEAEDPAFRVDDFEVPFDAKGTVVIYGDFRRRQISSTCQTGTGVPCPYYFCKSC